MPDDRIETVTDVPDEPNPTPPRAPARSFAEVLDDMLETTDVCRWDCEATHGTGRPCNCHRPAALRQLAEIAADAKALVAMHPEAKGRTRRAWALLERLALGPQEAA